MKTKITPLPDWCLTNLQPAFYDTESGSVLSLLSKIYGKINEVVAVTNEAYAYMDTHLDETINDLFEKGLEDGTFHSEFTLTYDGETETITLLDTLTANEES